MHSVPVPDRINLMRKIWWWWFFLDNWVKSSNESHLFSNCSDDFRFRCTIVSDFWIYSKLNNFINKFKIIENYCTRYFLFQDSSKKWFIFFQIFILLLFYNSLYDRWFTVGRRQSQNLYIITILGNQGWQTFDFFLFYWNSEMVHELELLRTICC